MSSTNRGRARNAQEFYPTPAWCVRALLHDPVAGAMLPGGHWFDPCAGDGAIIRAVNAARPNVPLQWSAQEIRPECERALRALAPDRTHIGDFLAPNCYRPARLTTICMNPPYSLAQQFIERALEMAPVVAMLLRLNYLEGASRARFWRSYQPDVFVLPNRPCFTGDGKTDSTAYAWFVWPNPWELPRRSRARHAGCIRVLDAVSREDRQEDPLS